LAFILAVEIPDEEADLAGNKMNWVARFGRMFGFVMIAILFFATSSYFLFFSSFLPRPLPVNHWILASMSLIPLVTSFIAALLRPVTYPQASKAVRFIIVALSALLILINVYFFLLAASRG
jgi:uncharacterized membrane protein